MLELTFEEIKPEYLIVRGDKVESRISRLKHYSPETTVHVFSIDEKAEIVSKSILDLPDDTLIYAIGNQVGVGQEILELLSRKRNNG
jgi:hypothetical protein